MVLPGHLLWSTREVTTVGDLLSRDTLFYFQGIFTPEHGLEVEASRLLNLGIPVRKNSFAIYELALFQAKVCTPPPGIVVLENRTTGL